MQGAAISVEQLLQWVPVHTIGTVTFRSDILQCVMSVAVSTVAVTVRARSGHGQAKDLSLTVSGP